MSVLYSKLFKEILTAYYQGDFENKINKLIINENIDRDGLCRIISSLCGVEISYSENFISDLKKAIENYERRGRVVSIVKKCQSCEYINGKSPCQNSCPFEAIIFNEKTGKVEVIKDKCIECGNCVDACTKGVFMDKVEFLPVLNILNDKNPVIAAVAPSIEGQFGENVTLGKLRGAFKKIGFLDMIEVAFFADMLTLKESVEFNNLIDEEGDFMLSSCCCPIWFGMLQKIYRDLIPHVSPSVSPMIACARVIKKLNPDFKVVFIGPCIAKKGEVRNPDVAGAVDFVLTFTEVRDIFEVFKINFDEIEEVPSLQYASREGRMYGRVGGVSISVNEAVARLFPDKVNLFTHKQANGASECKAILDKALKGEIDARFIEGMGCIGGCVGGPKTLIPREVGRKRVDGLADNTSVKISLDSDVMKELLHRLGIDSAKDFKEDDKEKIFERTIV